MTPVPVLVLALLVVVCGLGAWWVAGALRAAVRRDRALRAYARRTGLHVAGSDAAGVTDLRIGVLRQGDGRTVELLLWGERDGGPVRLFDLTTWTEHRGRSGEVVRTSRGYSCALVEVPGMLPGLTIEPEGMLARIANAVGGDDLQFESEAFNRAYRVTSEDARFASVFLGPKLMDWLLERRIPWTVDVGGWWVLCTTERLGAPAMVGLLEAACELRSLIPPVVYDLYPRAGTPRWER